MRFTSALTRVPQLATARLASKSSPAVCILCLAARPAIAPRTSAQVALLSSIRTLTEMEKADTSSRLENLRSLMRQRKVDVYVVPSEDSHASDYTAECDARRSFISGFTGSAGTAVVTLDKAALATDGRYFYQAEKQLDDNWTLLKTGLQDVPTWQEWAAAEAAGGKVVGVDPATTSASVAEDLNDTIKKAGGAELRAVSENLVDLVWPDRPRRPSNPVYHLPEKYTGKSMAIKLDDLRKDFEKKKSAGFVASSLDDVAWVFNLRGSDITYNPVFFAYAVITMDSSTLYTDDTRLTPECRSYLSENHVALKPYDALFADAEGLGAALVMTNEESGGPPKKFWISKTAPWALKLALGGDKGVIEVRSPIGDAKAVKTETEQEGMRKCHIRDGRALIEFFAWLEDQLVKSDATLDEVAAADKLEEIRKKQSDFVDLSFDTISSTGPNGAIIHYKPQRGNCSVINKNQIYLCDSGAQYYDGTTDTTRTLHFGSPTAAEKTAYTLVLKGHMALDMAVFPRGTTGYALDAFARQFLWKSGLDYRHGTGHGVGSFLCVHEGPFGIGTRKPYVDVPLTVGHVTSIEPGYYEDGNYGIRLENMAIVREKTTKHMFGDKPYLGFEHVTMVPFSQSLLDMEILTADERKWLNDYHSEVFEKTHEAFKDDALTMAWLKRETQPV